MVPALTCGFCLQNSDCWTRMTSLYGSQTRPVILCIYNSVLSNRITSLYGSPPLSVVLCMQNSDFRTTHRSLYGSLTSSVALSSHNSVISTRIKRLYWFQPSPVVFVWKSATAGPEWQVSMGPRHDRSYCACTTACLASELLVSLGPSLHLWFFHAKQRL